MLAVAVPVVREEKLLSGKKHPLFHFFRQMFEGYSKGIFSCCEKKRVQQGHDTRIG